MCFHEPALLVDRVLQAAAGNVERVANHDVRVVDPLAVDGDRLGVGDAEPQLDAYRVFALVPVRHVDQGADISAGLAQLSQPVGALLNQLFERWRMLQAVKRHGAG